jgi:lipopolysaccharide transport system permease protein
MAGVIEGFRWCVTGGSFPSLMYLPIWGVVLILLYSGLYYFNKLEDDIAEFI